jgi:hypothetical protein
VALVKEPDRPADNGGLLCDAFRKKNISGDMVSSGKSDLLSIGCEVACEPEGQDGHIGCAGRGIRGPQEATTQEICT